MSFNPDWTHLVVLVVSWLLGALGVGYPMPNRVLNKEKPDGGSNGPGVAG